jgi:hypothetical protein
LLLQVPGAAIAAGKRAPPREVNQMTKLLPRAAAAVFLLLASVQPPAWADAPIFRYNLHGVNIGPGPGPGPSGDASLAYPPVTAQLLTAA